MPKSLEQLLPAAVVIRVKGKGEDETIREIVQKKDRQGFSLADCQSKKSKPHVHRKTTEVYYGIAGLTVVEVNGTIFELKLGDVLVIKPGQTHWIPFSSEGRFLCLSNPPYDKKDTYYVDRNSFLAQVFVRNVRNEMGPGVYLRIGRRKFFIGPLGLKSNRRVQELLATLPEDVRKKISFSP